MVSETSKPKILISIEVFSNIELINDDICLFCPSLTSSLIIMAKNV